MICQNVISLLFVVQCVSQMSCLTVLLCPGVKKRKFHVSEINNIGGRVFQYSKPDKCHDLRLFSLWIICESFRFGVLLELQEAHNLKISRFRPPDKVVTLDPEQDQANFRTRLDNFETLDVRILNWAEHVLERLEDSIDQLDIGDKQLLYEETEAEVRNQQLQIFENIQQGEALLRGNFNMMTSTF